MSSRPARKPRGRQSNFAGIRLHIEYVPVASVRSRPRELRFISLTHIRKVAAGINRHGFNVPILTDDDLTVVSGQVRLEAATQLGLEQVPVIRICHLSREQVRLFSVFDNKVSEGVEWDEAALHLEFEELRLVEPTLELSDSGFAIGEIDAIAGRVRTADLNDLDDDPVPNDNLPPVAKLGDAWRCGRHSVICGDATDVSVIGKLVGDSVVHQAVVDFPYNLPTAAFSKSKKHGDFVAGAGEKSPEEFVAFLANSMRAMTPYLVDGALLYGFMDWRHIVELVEAGRDAGLTYQQLLCWVKDTPGMGSMYRSGHELVGVFKHGHGKHRNNNELGRFGRNRSNVLRYPGIRTSPGGRKALKMHPSVKNIALIADLILDASAPGDNILDTFGGSGTLMIAAEKVDRTAFICDLDPLYVDVTLRRFANLGIGEPTLEGKSFAEVATSRATSGEA